MRIEYGMWFYGFARAGTTWTKEELDQMVADQEEALADMKELRDYILSHETREAVEAYKALREKPKEFPDFIEGYMAAKRAAQ